MSAVLTLAWLTFHEARRRRMVLVAMVLGAVFLLLFGIGYQLIVTGSARHGTKALSGVETQITDNLLTMGGLYVVHFLAIMLAIVATVDAVSGEISSHTIQSIVTKPLFRWQVIAGKWIGYTVMLALYTGLLCLGILLESALIAGYLPPNVVPGVALIIMQTAVLVSLSLLCGVYVSTLTNGVILFMLYGLAFIGSWVEQIGTLFQSSATEQIGVVSSLMLPVEALWRLSAFQMQPSLLNNLNISPFSLGTVPSMVMVIYAGGYVLGLLLLAMRAFTRRDL
ncbi:MAG TPA: ABC transporter permease subunit [Ktedonobacterales bacterium]|nr:ABC transporter permease subunit [Ktedonobacterales bacterium]